MSNTMCPVESTHESDIHSFHFIVEKLHLYTIKPEVVAPVSKDHKVKHSPTLTIIHQYNRLERPLNKALKMNCV